MTHPQSESAAHVSFAEAFRFWLKLGFISFGGPAGQIAIMHEELVERRRWISERRFLHALNYCMVLPGPEAQQLATYIGWLMHGIRGGLVAGSLFVAPSVAILISLSWAYMAWGKTPIAEGLLLGIQPAVVGIVAAAVLRVGARAIRSIASLGLAISAFIVLAWGAPFPAIVLSAGILGYLGGRWRPDWFTTSKHGTHSTQPAGESAIFDDNHQIPPQAFLGVGRWVIHAFVGFLAWALPMALLVAWVGPKHSLVEMGLFFTQAALVTFGGAYAVLPYVMNYAAVTGWCERSQSMTGLALGETTPGPLIMFVAFVGFVGGWQTNGLAASPVGLNAPWQTGVAGALVATYFTFLPSFLFVLLGAPFIERTRGIARLSSALGGITAAVVGVMTHLAFFLAYEVVWQAMPNSWTPAVIATGAFVAIRFGRWEIAKVVAICAALGLAAHSLGVAGR